ncbi:MAG: RHS repeat-associated core domain-containing protein [Anaerolineaceae bacterium]|nr:RHS repeat-associated core domain-containing protein [Anaerolineaceae bacterium]
MVDDEANLQLAQSFTPFGEELEKFGDAEANFGYTGQKYDAQTGLLYLRARYYAPGSGRFVSKDTWSGDSNMPMSFNAWLYGYGNPVRYVDPSGKIPKREDIIDGQVVYSSKCGFIDFGHVNTFVVNEIIDALKKEEVTYNEKYHIFTAKFSTPPTLVSEKNSSVTAIVQKGLSEQQRTEVALGIWRTLNDKVETHQNALWFTSYSFEDLSSDEIGFYLALEKGNVDPRINQDSWDWLADKCEIDKENCIQKSLDVYDAWGGFVALLAKPPKIEEWGRALVCRGELEYEEVDLPAIFTRITPILPSVGGIWYEKPDEPWWKKWTQKK